MVDAISASLSGLQSSAQQASAAAVKIATASVPKEDGSESDTDLATELVTLKQAALTYKANAKVLSTVQDMEKELLSTFSIDA